MEVRVEEGKKNLKTQGFILSNIQMHLLQIYNKEKKKGKKIELMKPKVKWKTN